MPITTPQPPQMFRLETQPGMWLDQMCAAAYREKQSCFCDVCFDFNGIKLDTTMADDAGGLAEVYDRLHKEAAAAYRKTPAYAALQKRLQKEAEKRAAYLAKPHAFPMAAVISAYTGRLVTEFGAMWKVLDYMTGEELFSHQTPRAAEWVRPHLLAQVPALAKVDVSALETAIAKAKGTNDAAERAAVWVACREWVRAQRAVIGLPATVTLHHVPGFAAMDPIAELASMLAPEN